MYIRWKKQRRRPKWAEPYTLIDSPGKATILGAEGTVTLACQLVESCRNDAGKPRQRIVAHLATIREHALQDGLARAAFWDAFIRKLAQVPLCREQYETLIHATTARVPFPTRRARERYLRLRGERGNSVYEMYAPDGFRTVVRSRPLAPRTQHGTQHARQDGA